MDIDSRNLIGGLFVLATLYGVAHGDIILDDFDNDPNDGLLGARTLSSVIHDDPFGQGGNTFVDTGFSFGDEAGALIMNSGIGARQRATLRYNQSIDPFDLSDNGILAFDFLQVDQDFDIRIVITADSGGKAVIDQFHISAGGEQTFLFDILNDADFVNLGLSDINDIRIVFNEAVLDNDGGYAHTASLDFVLGGIRAVPSPGSMALLGLGGLMVSRRRR